MPRCYTKWTRKWKIELIGAKNPAWLDLAENFVLQYDER